MFALLRCIDRNNLKCTWLPSTGAAPSMTLHTHTHVDVSPWVSPEPRNRMRVDPEFRMLCQGLGRWLSVQNVCCICLRTSLELQQLCSKTRCKVACICLLSCGGRDQEPRELAGQLPGPTRKVWVQRDCSLKNKGWGSK